MPDRPKNANAYVEITIEIPSGGVEVLTGGLALRGIEGCVIEDPDDLRELLDGPAGVYQKVDESLMPKEGQPARVKYYLPENEQGREDKKTLLEYVERLKSEGGLFGGLTLRQADTDDGGWQDAWKEHFKPVRVGERLVVRPSWEEYTPSEGEVVLTLDPGAAFGTGTHESTRLCLQMLERHVTAGIRTADIGCGSGILSVAAVLLGGAFSTGWDVEQLAVDASRQNARLNGADDLCLFERGNILEQPELAGRLAVYAPELTVCNIVADVIIPMMPVFAGFIPRGRTLILSGFVTGRSGEVLSAAEKSGFRLTETREENGWVAAALTKT